MSGKIKFHSDAPMLKYSQKPLNICCFSSLASEFHSINQTKTANDIQLRIEESLKSKVGNHIDFAKCYFEKRKKLKGEPRVYYILMKY